MVDADLMGLSISSSNKVWRCCCCNKVVCSKGLQMAVAVLSFRDENLISVYFYSGFEQEDTPGCLLVLHLSLQMLVTPREVKILKILLLMLRPGI